MVKRLFTYVFAVFGIVLVMGFPISGEEQMIGENLLSNSSFEEVDQDGRPLSYIIGAFQGSPQILVDDTVFRTGSKSIKLLETAMIAVRFPSTWSLKVANSIGSVYGIVLLIP